MNRNYVNFMPSFNKGNKCNSNRHLNEVLKILSNQIGSNDLVIHDGWATQRNIDDIFHYFKKKILNNIYYVSLVDEFSSNKDYALKKLSKIAKNIKLVGNTNPGTDSYYSFWLDYVYNYREQYLSFDVTHMQDNVKTYMCLNRKPHHHRQYLFQRLCKRKLSEHGHLSFHNLLNLPVDIVSTNKFEPNVNIKNDIDSLGHPMNWQTHFLNIVTETTFSSGPYVFFSEKIWKPIIGRRPFILLGREYMYNSLHHYGFDTFDDIFGTGYKTDDLHLLTDWIIKVIKSLKNIDKIALYKELLPRLEKNYDIFLDIAQENKRKRDNLCR